ncbi:MAG: carboxypeptidase-like regulatory domain-containing protein [Candidatus Thermoplasmatota archaeon]
MAVRAALGITVVLLLSGCSSSPEPVALATAPETGCIRFIVVDAGIRPLPGVTLTFVNPERDVTTDAEGRVDLCDLAPGAYFVVANRTGYDIAQRLIQVEANVQQTVTFTLDANPGLLAYHQTLPFRGYAEVAAGLATPVVDPLLAQAGLAACTCRFMVTPDRAVVAITLEATWTDSVADPTGPTEYLYRVVAQGVNGTASGQMANPLVKPLNRLDFADPAFSFSDAQGFEVSLFPDAVWPAAGQSFDLFVTLWYGTPPPPGWSFLGGSR